MASEVQAHNLTAATTVSQKDSVVQEYANEKEKRLAEHVAHLEATRHTAGAEGFKRSQNIKIKGIVNELLVDGQSIEDKVVSGENEIFFKNEDNFFIAQDEQEITALKTRQQKDIRSLRALQEQQVQDANKRAVLKRYQRELQREIKNLFDKTHNQETAYRKTDEVKLTLLEHRERNEKHVEHIEERHQRQIKQFTAAEERKVMDQRILMELQVRHLSEDQKAEAMKEYHSKMTHQKNVDKKRLDQIREQQRTELRHLRDRADCETRMMEEFANMQSKHTFDQQASEAHHRADYVNEKERMATAEQALKLLEMAGENATEIKKMQAHHQSQIRHMQRAQNNRRDKRVKRWSAILGRDLTIGKKFGSGASSVGSKSQSESQSMSRQDTGDSHQNPNLVLVGANDDLNDGAFLGMENESHAKEQIAQMREQLKKLAQRQEKNMIDLVSKHQAEFSAKEEEYQKVMMELEWQQDVELKDSKKADADNIHEALAIQERELAMDGHIRGAETKALQERRVLNSLLDSVVDGVISIDPRGFICKFNISAEKQFGYSSSEIIGKNIKELMPQRYSVNHDDYLYNYLSTGVKKVIGTGRVVYAMRRDKSEFPVSLAISEVIEDGFHLFTAIVRDLTEQFEAEKLKQAEDDCLPQMIWKIDLKGNALSLNKRFLNYTGVTEDKIKSSNVFDPAVIHPEDVGPSKAAFINANKTKQPFEVKRRILGCDGNYKWFLTRGSPIFDANFEISVWCGSCTDIDSTEKLQAELQILPESLPQLLWKIDLNGDVVYSNSKFQAYLGISKNTTGVNVFSPKVVHPEDVTKSRQLFDDAVRTKSPFETTRRLKGVDGKYKFFVTRGAPIIDVEGILTCFYGTCTDINESQELQKEMTLLPESLPQMVWKVTTNGDVLYANTKFKDYVGAVEGQALNVFSDKVVHKDDHKQSLATFNLANKEKKEFESKRRLLSAGGYYKKFVTRGTPVINSEGNITCWYGTCTDLDD